MQNRLRDVESRLEIEVNAVIPLLFGKLRQRQRSGLGWTANLSHAGIVNEDVKASKAG